MPANDPEARRAICRETVPAVRLSRRTLAAPGLARLLRARSLAMCSHEPGVLADAAPEPLHDYRVALRAIRCWLAAMKGVMEPSARRQFRADFAALGALTGNLRDLDVSQPLLKAAVAACPELSPAVARGLEHRLGQRRVRARRLLHRYFQGQAYRDLLKRWWELLDALAAGDAAGKRGRERLAQVVTRALRRETASLFREQVDALHVRPAQLHALRKDCKRVRYLVEGFHSLLDPALAARAIKALKALQTSLGQTQDLQAQRDLLVSLAAGWAAQRQPRAPLTVGPLLQRLDQRLATSLLASAAAVSHFQRRRVRRLFERLADEPA